MSESGPVSGLDAPSGFQPSHGPGNPVPTNESSISLGGLPVPPPLPPPPRPLSEAPAKSSSKLDSRESEGDGGCMEGQTNGGRATRRRVRPLFFDPSPLPTKKRGRGRPPGPRRKRRSFSWTPDRELVLGNAPRVLMAPLTRLSNRTDIYSPPTVRNGENQLSSPKNNQSGKQSIYGSISVPMYQYKDQCPKQKVEPQDDASAEGHGPAKEGTCSLNNHPSLCHLRSSFDDRGESHSTGDDIAPHMGSCAVNPSLVPTLKAILKKHGNIAKDCPLESGFMRTSVLEGICKVVLELQTKELNELDDSSLFAYYSALKDAQSMKLNVKWLQHRLDEIRDAMELFVETKRLIDKKRKQAEHIEYMKKNLQFLKVEFERLHSEIEEKEGQLAVGTQENEKLGSRIIAMASKFQCFENKSLIDGLL